MKRLLAVLLALSLLLVVAATGFAEEIAPDAQPKKITKTDRRVTAYTEYLRELFDEGVKITHVGLADINKDKLPELFYVIREGGESSFGFCGYESNEVFDYDCDENYLGTRVGAITLMRYKETKTGEHCWALRTTTIVKNDEKRFENFTYVITRAGYEIIPTLKFSRDWKGGKTKTRYYMDGMETVASVYNSAIDEFFGREFRRADTTTYRNRGVVSVVASQKWLNIRSAMNTSTKLWKDLPPYVVI